MDESTQWLTKDHMFVAYNPVTGEVQQLVFDTVADGKWTFLVDRWRRLSDSDDSLSYLILREIAPQHALKAKEYFQFSLENKEITNEAEYRMWYS